MSDDESMNSVSEEDDIGTAGLIATRQKRSTAGNLYATLRANLDDEELQKELLAEDEDEDAEDYEGSDKDVEDDVLESSSDDEDAGPPKEGEEDIEGEKTIRKQERAEARNKRKAHDARLKLPAWRQKKKVKLADDVKTENDSSATELHRPKKKSERSNWLPTAADAPVRQSGRALAVANRESVHANLKQSAERSEKQRRVMKVAAEREKSRKRMKEMSQEERLKKCERIERETGKELGRFEREEAERQRIREELLAAKRKRGLEGPFVRAWSGSVLWEGPKIKVNRLEHGSQPVKDVKVAGEIDNKALISEPSGPDTCIVVKPKAPTDNPATASTIVPATGPATALAQQEQVPRTDPPEEPKSNKLEQGAAPQITSNANAPEPPAHAPVPWLQGIQEYAAQPDPEVTAQAPPGEVRKSLQSSERPPFPISQQQSTQQPSNISLESEETKVVRPSGQAAPDQHDQQPQPQPQPQPSSASQQPNIVSHLQQNQSQAPNTKTVAESVDRTPLTSQPDKPLGSHQFSVQPPSLPPQDPPVPLLREQAARSLIVLEEFPSLGVTGTSKRTPKQKDTTFLETDPLKSIILPESYPPFTPEEAKYLIARPKPRARQTDKPLFSAPAKVRCALTSWVAKFRDPKTSVPYADMHQYKALQRVIAGGNQWSPLLGCWVGPALGGGMGRPARGVPAGFTGEKKES